MGRKALSELTTIVTPDTILRWHRELVAQKWDYTDRRKKKPGRPAISDEVKQLVLRMAKENPDWGYDRIQGALANLGHEISDQTVGNILKAHGIETAPERRRQTTWKTFLKAHWDVLGAIDFTTVEVWTKGGLVTFYLLFVMQLKTRRVHFAGCTGTVRNLVASYIDQHNRHLPHSAFRGQTPDEMYFGTGGAIAKQLEASRIAARQSRLEAIRAQTCRTCEEIVSISS